PQRIGVVTKKPTAPRLHLEQSVNGFRGKARRFTQPLGGTSSRSAQEAFNLLRPQDHENGVYERGFANPGTAGNDKQARSQSLPKRLPLAGGQHFASALLAPGNRFFELHRRIGGRVPDQFQNSRSDFLLGPL